MNEVTRQEISACLRQVGVEAGDGVLVHSALQFLGKPEGGIGVYLDALLEVLGPEGTAAVPAFNFGFARGEDYDPASAPAVGMGSFSEYVRQRPEARRTSHPMQSFAVIGKRAEDLAARDTPGAFDDGSAVDRMVALGFKLLLLGADIQAVSLFHYCEQRAGVPYRYWKEFSGRVRREGEWQEATYKMFVRDMEVDARIEIYSMQALMERENQWKAVKLNYGLVSLCTFADFLAAAAGFLSRDPWVFVTNRPEGV